MDQVKFYGGGVKAPNVGWCEDLIKMQWRNMEIVDLEFCVKAIRIAMYIVSRTMVLLYVKMVGNVHYVVWERTLRTSNHL